MVVFRGTKNLLNWLENIQVYRVDFEPETCDKCEVHAGFYDIYLSMKDDIFAHIDMLNNKYPNS